MRMFKNGRSQTEIADKHGVSRERVRQVLVSYGGHKSRIDPEITKNKILKLYRSDCCVDTIAKKLGKSFNYITKVLTRDNLSINPLHRYQKHFDAVVLAAQPGETILSISKKLRMSTGVVCYVLEKYLNEEKLKEMRDRGEELRKQHAAEANRKED
jgi:hypothetical protein